MSNKEYQWDLEEFQYLRKLDPDMYSWKIREKLEGVEEFIDYHQDRAHKGVLRVVTLAPAEFSFNLRDLSKFKIGPYSLEVDDDKTDLVIAYKYLESIRLELSGI